MIAQICAKLNIIETAKKMEAARHPKRGLIPKKPMSMPNEMQSITENLIENEEQTLDSGRKVIDEKSNPKPNLISGKKKVIA